MDLWRIDFIDNKIKKSQTIEFLIGLQQWRTPTPYWKIWDPKLKLRKSNRTQKPTRYYSQHCSWHCSQYYSRLFTILFTTLFPVLFLSRFFSLAWFSLLSLIFSFFLWERWFGDFCYCGEDNDERISLPFPLLEFSFYIFFIWFFIFSYLLSDVEAYNWWLMRISVWRVEKLVWRKMRVACGKWSRACAFCMYLMKNEKWGVEVA